MLEGINLEEWDRLDDVQRQVQLTKYEREKALREQSEKGARTASPPRSFQDMTQAEYLSRHPPSQVVELTPPHDRQGAGPPEFIQQSPHEQKFANALARIDGLERRVSQIEARLQRFFNEPSPRSDRI